MERIIKYFSEGTRIQKLEKLVFSFILLLVSKFSFPISTTPVVIILNDLLTLLTISFAFAFIDDILSAKRENPISLTINIGISGAIIFFMFSVSSYFSEYFSKLNEISELFFTLISITVSAVIISLLLFIVVGLRLLSLLRQKKSHSNNFSIMLVLFLLSALGEVVIKFFPDATFVTYLLLGLSLVFVLLNSFKVAWIAFLNQREKLFLLLLSFIISGGMGLNMSVWSDSNFIYNVFNEFSVGMHQLFFLTMIFGNTYFGIVFFTTLFHLPTTVAFAQKSDEISSLIDIGNLLTQGFDLKELTDNLTNSANKICNSDSAWILIKNEDDFELTSVSNIDFKEADLVSDALLKEIDLPKFEPVLFEDKIIRISSGNTFSTFSFKSILILPLKIQTHLNGFLIAVKRQMYKFEEDEKKSLGAFADYAAIAIENARLLQESIEKERMENELEVARTMQSKLLPQKLPVFNNLEIDALFVPAFEVGGDYYDFFEIGENKIAFIVADVSGKGVQASYIMAEVKGIFESLSQVISNPKELLLKANDLLCNSLNEKSFVTALYGIIDLESGVLNFSRAGHVPLLVCSQNIVSQYSPKGIGLGLNSTALFSDTLENMEIQLNNDDILILYTDGITESQNKNDEDFGVPRLKKIIETFCENKLSTLTKNIFQEVSLFADGRSQHDDITLVLFKWKTNKPEFSE